MKYNKISVRFILSILIIVLAFSAMFILASCNEEAQASLEIDEYFKQTYFKGEEVDVTGGSLIYTDKNGEEYTIDITDSMIKGFNSSTSGVKNLKVQYEGLEVQLPYTVYGIRLGSYYLSELIEVDNINGEEVSQPVSGSEDKFTFYSNLAVSATIEGYTMEGTFSPDVDYLTVSFNGQDSRVEIEGDQIKLLVNINEGVDGSSYSQYQVFSYKEAQASLEIDKYFKQTYFKGEEVDVTGGSLIYTDKNGEEFTIDITDSMIKGFNSSTSGVKNLKVQYEGLEVQLPYTVYGIRLGSYYLSELIEVDNINGEEVSQPVSGSEDKFTFYSNLAVSATIEGYTMEGTFSPDVDYLTVSFNGQESRVEIEGDQIKLLVNINEGVDGSSYSQYQVFSYRR